jgi:type IV pilus assembly protein PilM
MIDTSAAAAVHLGSAGQVSYAAAAVPEGMLDVGPVGLQAVDRDALQELIAALNQQVDGGRKAALVTPSSWVRVHLLEFDNLPRRRAEVDEVVRWRLKKLLPVAPSQLRLVTVPVSPVAGRKRLLCTVGLEQPLADLEAAFSQLGIHTGAIAPRLFALLNRSKVSAPYRLLVQQESGFLSLVLLEQGEPSLIRTKPMPEPEGPWPVVVREQHLALSFLREELAIESNLQVAISAEAEELDQSLRGWWNDQEGAEVEPQSALIPGDQPSLAEQLGRSRLEPVYAMLGGISR